jgi:cyclophilin family peptidyl-prolyl cis-trans isomerase
MKHTIFGHVVGNGMDIVNLIDQNDLMKKSNNHQKEKLQKV